jgi:autotransporter-associated beta strand protein
MALIKWKAAVNGDWSTATDWSTGAVPTAADDAAINLVGNYTVTVTNAHAANTLDFNAPGALLVESATGRLTLNSLRVDSGTVELNGVNTIGATTLNGGLLTLGRSGALGTGSLTLTGGELRATVSQSLINPLNFISADGAPATAVISAAHAKVLNLNGSAGWNFGINMSVQFGTPGVADGVVIWHTPAGSTGAPRFVEVNAGTLKAGDSGFSNLVTAGDTIVGLGATLDLGGFSTTIGNLTGLGTITNSGAPAILTVAGSDNGFGGTIVGALSLKVVNTVGGVTDLVLNGTNTYTGNTTITQNGVLLLGAGGTTGSIAATSPIVNDGQLVINRSNAVALSNPMSGGGMPCRSAPARRRSTGPIPTRAALGSRMARWRLAMPVRSAPAL